MQFYMKYDNRNDLGLICFEMSLSELSYRWISAKLQYLHYVSNGVTVVLR